MHTKKALQALAAGDADQLSDIQSPELRERSAAYLEQYNQRDTAISSRKARNGLNIPMLDALKRKVAKTMGETERGMPVAMRFYAYTAMKSAAEGNQKDRGVVQAARHLENLWQKDPMGSLTLGQVMDLRAHLANSFPKSKVGKILEATISQVGYSTLPVAKISRLAQQIESQSDFDALIKTAGLDGSRPEQIKSRTLVRELVAMRGTKLDAEPVADDRNTFERVSDRLDKEAQIAPLVEDAPLEPNIPGDSMGMDDMLPPGEPGLPDAGPALMTPGSEEEAVDEIVPMIEEVDQIVEDTMPPAAEPFVEQELAEGGALPGTAEWGFQEAQEGHTEPPPTEMWQQEELEEHGIGGPGMDEPPMDGIVDEMPPIEEPGMPGLNNGLSGKVMAKRAAIQEAMGTRVAQHDPSSYYYSEALQLPHPVKNLPKPNFGHDMQRRKTVKQLDAELKAGKITTREYLTQKRQLEDGARIKTQFPGASAQEMAPKSTDNPDGMFEDVLDARTAEGMDAPKPAANGQIKRVNNDAPDRSKDGGNELTKNETRAAFTLTAAQIEAALIDRGEEVKYGSACLRINESDEVEFWHKGAGRACDLVDLDVAITDFLTATASEHEAAQPKGQYSVTTLVPVPCARCAKIDLFEMTADTSDVYACGDCGSRTKAASIAVLVKHGQLGTQYAITVEVPSHITFDAQVKRMFEQKMASAVNSTRAGQLFQRSPNEWEIMVSDEDTVRKLQRILATLGIEQTSARRTAQFDAGSASVPGSADQAIPQDAAPQANASPQPAPQGGQGAPVAPGAALPGSITGEDIAAAFRHYKAMELPFPEAMAQFAKDYKEKIEAGWESPRMDAELIDIARQLYTSSGAGSGPSAPQVMQARVSWNLAKKSFNNPKVNAQQPDALKPATMKQPNSDERDTGRMQAPKPKTNGKQPGAGSQPGTAAPPKDLGSTNEDKHPSGLDAPKPPADGHVDGAAGDQPGTAPGGTLELGKDSDHNGKSIPVPGKFGPRPKAGATNSKPSTSKSSSK